MSIKVKEFPSEKVVDYNDFRSEIRSGDLLLCSGSGVFSRMIQIGTKSIWSHVAFVMRLDWLDRVMVLESLEPVGVRTVPLSKYLNDYNSKGDPYPGGLIIARHTAFQGSENEEELRKLGQFSVRLFGYPYDKDEIARIAARIATSYLPFTKRDPQFLERDREFICSEYVWECYNALNISIDYDKRGFVAPADFARQPEISLIEVLKSK